jgi:hypothetical protein
MSTKVSELTSLGSAPADTDVIPVVDVSDTSQAASGTLKKLAASYLAKTDGTAATITGGGTVALGGYTLTVGATGTASLSGHTHVEADITDLGAYAENINDLGDVVITTPADNEVLAYDSGGNWINQTPAEAGLAEATHTHVEADITDLGSYLTAVALNDVSDVTIDTPADNEVLAWNGTDTWINQTAAEAGLAAATHTHVEADITDLGSYEAALGNPGTDGYVLSSTTGGTRSWVAQATGLDEIAIPLHVYGISTTNNTYTSVSGFFYFSSAYVPSGYSIYFGCAGKKASSSTCYIALAEIGTTTAVSGTELTFTTTDYVWAESSALTLTNGTIYHVIIRSSTSSVIASGVSPQLIIRKD